MSFSLIILSLNLWLLSSTQKSKKYMYYTTIKAILFPKVVLNIGMNNTLLDLSIDYENLVG